MSKQASDDLSDEEIAKYLDDLVCPRCRGEVERISNHERCSANDLLSCPACRWQLTEMATWSFVLSRS